SGLGRVICQNLEMSRFVALSKNGGKFPLKIVNQLSISLLAAAAVIAAPAYAFTPESSDPIKIVDNNWSSQKVLARVAQQLLEKVGYETKIVPSDSQGQ